MEKKKYFWSCFLLAGLLGFVAVFTAYWYPNGLFWDENYHIASAQKYIDGVMFMEPHPPLGKQILALGEAIFNAFGLNKGIDKSSFLTTDYITSVPEGFSFAGFRFFSVFFAFLSSFFIFLIFYLIFSNPLYALLFSSFYIFENAIIMHSRGAMLEGIQLFFVILSTFYFIYLIKVKNGRKLLDYFLLAIFAGLAISVKVNSMIVLLFFVFLAWEDYREEILKLKFSLGFIKDFFLKATVSVVGVLLVVFLSFYAHFAICNRVVSGRYYQASNEYKEILAAHKTTDVRYFPVMLRDYISYIILYEKGVPKWDPTKKGENGSPAFTWPFGYKSINYRWTKWRGKVAYLYLQGNPLIWLCGLLGVFLSIVFVVSKIFFGAKIKDSQRFRWISYFVMSYLFYLYTMFNIERVMYLYHYFIPLIFSFILFALIFYEFFGEYIEKNDRLMLVATSIFALEIFAVFLFYSPFTYYIPIDSIQFMKRVWTKIWDLVPITY
ncbi:MAG: phospholipid carrier-dependent glycosyltransferase [Brevinematia bacterium]